MQLNETTPTLHARIKGNHTFDKYNCNACQCREEAFLHLTAGAGALLLIKTLHTVKGLANLTVTNGT